MFGNDAWQNQRPAPPPPPQEPEGPACVHGAPPGKCAFVGCTHYRPDGPRDEKWAFRPGTTQEDVDAALASNAETHARAPGSASPIHLVVEGFRKKRTGE